MANILIIDDEPGILDLMAQVCHRTGHTIHPCIDAETGLKILEELKPELLIVDLQIGEVNGLQLIQKARQECPNTAIVMVTGHGSVETAVEAMRLGAFDYLSKPFEIADFQKVVSRALSAETTGASLPVTTTPEPPEPPLLAEMPIIGESPEIQRILRIAKKVADGINPVLLEGAFGTGKQTLARAIHNASTRKNAPFKTLHCGALSEELLEHELFGLGIDDRTIFSRAGGGAVFLEEINALPLRLQTQLDTFLEEIASRRLAGSLPPEKDFRLIASTTTPLEEFVGRGEFREDLLYRLSVIPISVPPLRERVGDIPLLAEHFLENHARSTGEKKKKLDASSKRFLSSHTWPGNVSELQNAIERAATFAEGTRILPADLPPKVTQKIEVSHENFGEPATQALPVGTQLAEFVRIQERLFIRETLHFNGGSREKTAGMLGISIATLYRKMGLRVERERLLAG